MDDGDWLKDVVRVHVPDHVPVRDRRGLTVGVPDGGDGDGKEEGVTVRLLRVWDPEFDAVPEPDPVAVCDPCDGVSVTERLLADGDGLWWVRLRESDRVGETPKDSVALGLELSESDREAGDADEVQLKEKVAVRLTVSERDLESVGVGVKEGKWG